MGQPTATDPDCLFCKIRDGKIPSTPVYRDDEVVAFRDINPAAPTHVLLIPTNHVPSADALGESDVPAVGRLVLRATRLARELGLVEGGYRLVVNNGEGAGQSVFHLHVHLLGGRRMGWPPG